MKLYNAMLSPFAGRCRMLIYLKGLDVEIAEYGEELSREDVLALNPMGKIPVLEDDGWVLPESEVICEYLEDRFPTPPLRPAGDRERARMQLVSRIADLYLFEPLSPLFGHLSRKARDQAVVDRQLQELRRGLAMLEHFISTESFAAGNEFTLADCTLAPVLLFVDNFLPYFDLEQPFEDSPGVSAYWSQIQHHEIANRVLDEIRAALRAKAGG